MKKLKEFLRDKSIKLAIVSGAVVSSVAAGLGCFAEGGDYDTATTALTTSITGLKTQALTILGTVVGIAVVIMGGYWLIKLGMKWFKGLSK